MNERTLAQTARVLWSRIDRYVLEVVLYQYLCTVGVVLQPVHVLAGTVEIFGGQFAARGHRIEDVAEYVLSLTIFFVEEIAILLLDAYHRITAGKGYTARKIELTCGLPTPHRHGLNLFEVCRIGREIEARAFQILDIGGDAFTVNAVHEELEPRTYFDVAAELCTPTEQRGIAVGVDVVSIQITEYGRCTQMTFAVVSPSYLQIDRKIGHALRKRCEEFVVGGTYFRHFGCQSEGQVFTGEGDFIAEHRCELQVVGIGALKIDGRGCGLQIAEGRDVATDRETLERYISRTQARRIAALCTAAEITVDVDNDAAQSTGIGDGFQENTRRRGIHGQFLTSGIVARNGNVIRNEIEVVDGAFEFIGRAQSDVAAQCEREPVVFAGKDELRNLRLLGSRTVSFHIILRRTLYGQTIERRHLSCSAYVGVDRINFVHGDQIDRRRILTLSGESPAVLRRCSGGQ